jgi:hypothetical protein
MFVTAKVGSIGYHARLESFVTCPNFFLLRICSLGFRWQKGEGEDFAGIEKCGFCGSIMPSCCCMVYEGGI